MYGYDGHVSSIITIARRYVASLTISMLPSFLKTSLVNSWNIVKQGERANTGTEDRR